MKYKMLHIDFMLNETSFSSQNELLSFTKNTLTEVYTFLIKWFDESDVVEVFTSGSTGKPKAIELKKEYMLNSAIATGQFFDLPSKTRALHCLPIHFIAGKMMLVRAIVLGWHLDMVLSDSTPLRSVFKKYDFSAMVPLQLNNSLDKLFLIRKLIVGGGTVSKNLQSRIKNISTEIYATYGMTETITHIAIKSLNLSSKMKYSSSNYQILPNVSIEVDNRKCLIIIAYELSDKIIYTNDIVDIDSNKKSFKWLGRYDNMINSGGIKLIPEEIEEKISKIIQGRFFITSLPDDILGEKVVLIVENKTNPVLSHTKKEREKLKTSISTLESISKFAIPKEIYFIDKFSLTKTNKIDRNKTKELIP